MTMAPQVTNATTEVKVGRQDRLNKILDEASKIVEADWKTYDNNDDDETDSVTSSSSPQRTSISFAVSIKVHDIISLDDYSDKELRKCWYSIEDKDKMSASKDKIVARLEKGKAPRGSMTYRGLECWTVKGGQDLDENIARVIDAVMDEQDRQWKEEKDDWDRMAELSREATKDSALRARQVALEDEKEAKEAWTKKDDLTDSAHSRDVSVKSSATTESKKSLRRRRSSTKKNRDFWKKDNTAIESSESGEDTSSAQKTSAIEALSDEAEIKRKSKKGKKKKKARKSTKDPPARVIRTKSQEASEFLLTMRRACREAKSMKV